MENKKIRVAINGCGRIGRAFLKLAINKDNIEIVAVNDLGSIENIAYLLKYDSAYGISKLEIKTKDNFLIVNKNEIKYLNERDPKELPWKDLNIDVVVEATGVFTTYEKSQSHIDAGAKRVVITAPVKESPSSEKSKIEGRTILMGVNDDDLNLCKISSNASCTTNAGSPVLEILRNTVGIEKAMLNTVHGYTATQKIVDGPNEKDFRKGRAGAQNIIPSTTGAAIATTKAIKELEGKFDGISMRVPVIAGSLLDITFIAKRDTSVEEINNILKEASGDSHWEGIFTTTKDPVVSSDIVGLNYAGMVDLQFTRVIGGNLVKVLVWYDNEMGYTNTLIKHIEKAGSLID